jgi:hypothetical protein
MATVAQLMRANATLSNIPVCGPSCLNPDYAYAWWDTMKGSLQMGNTHQLAGTFDNFAGFYQKVTESGLPSAGDELHNINDAIIGMNYGMTYGIWWSDYGGYTRAELGNATGDGRMIGYKENRSLWTSAAVFRRNSQQLVEAFLGTSERQAGESSFTFVSEDRLAYFDGHGPFYSYTKHTPGGTGYSIGQTNSEYVIEVAYGEDVPVGPAHRRRLQNRQQGHGKCIDQRQRHQSAKRRRQRQQAMDCHARGRKGISRLQLCQYRQQGCYRQHLLLGCPEMGGKQWRQCIDLSRRRQRM